MMNKIGLATAEGPRDMPS